MKLQLCKSCNSIKLFGGENCQDCTPQSTWEEEWESRFGFLEKIVERQGFQTTNWGNEIKDFIRTEIQKAEERGKLEEAKMWPEGYMETRIQQAVLAERTALREKLSSILNLRETHSFSPSDVVELLEKLKDDLQD